MDATVPPILSSDPPVPAPKTRPQTTTTSMTKYNETLFAAELCELLCEQDTFSIGVSRIAPRIGALPGTVKIHLLDGTKNGSPTQAAAVQFRHVSNAGKEVIFITIRGSGVSAREKWLMENDCNPVSMSQTRGIPILGKHADDIRVHKGVLRGYRSIQLGLRNIAKQCPPRSKLVIAGYGVGGAIASVAALDLANRNRADPYHADIPIRLLTFASPKYFANKTFYASLRTFIPRVSSYACAWDPVPRMKTMDRVYTRPSWITNWIHTDETPVRVTHSVTPPARVALGCWPLCCGCGPRDDPEDHHIGKMIEYLRQTIKNL